MTAGKKNLNSEIQESRMSYTGDSMRKRVLVILLLSYFCLLGIIYWAIYTYP